MKLILVCLDRTFGPFGANKAGFNLWISYFNIRGKLSIIRCNKQLFLFSLKPFLDQQNSVIPGFLQDNTMDEKLKQNCNIDQLNQRNLHSTALLYPCGTLQSTTYSWPNLNRHQNCNFSNKLIFWFKMKSIFRE